MRWRGLLGSAAAAYAAAVLWATLGPAPWHTVGFEVPGGILNPAAWTAPGTWSTGYLSEIAFNIAMFIPVGVLAAGLLPRRRAGLALAIGIAFTVCIELGQLPLPDRISDPRDLVANSAGAVVGVVAVAATRLVRGALPLLDRARERTPGIAPAMDAPPAGAAASGRATAGVPTAGVATPAEPAAGTPAPAVSGRRAA